MRHRIILHSTIIASLTLFSACTSRPFFYSYKPVDSDGWAYTDTLRFAVDKIPHNGLFTLSLYLRCTNRLPYQDMWLVLEQRNEPSYRHRDTIYIEITDSNGIWHEGGNILHNIETKVRQVSLDSTQIPIELLVYPIIDEQLVKGITDIGIKIE